MYDYTQLKNGAAKEINGKKLTSEEQAKYLEELITKYPIDSIEDGMDENDWEGWKILTDLIGDRCQLVGDDFFVTNVKYLEKRESPTAAPTRFSSRSTRSARSQRLSAP